MQKPAGFNAVGKLFLLKKNWKLGLPDVLSKLKCKMKILKIFHGFVEKILIFQDGCWSSGK